MAHSPSAGAIGEIRIIAQNKKLAHDLDVERHLEAGIVLCGSEVKSIRGGRVVLTGAHVRILGGEALVFGLTINEYAFSHQFTHEPLAQRKLLLHTHEIAKLQRDLEQKGCTAAISRIYWRGSRVKLDISIGTGKKLHDKRQTIKEADARRDMQRAKR
jgi:SsrA-binding protein